ncbi:MAG: hypothetical protein CMK43_08870 [Porticoccaceae bacterium]|nr:hypothetical protein [Porticoccaceae bacterium]
MVKSIIKLNRFERRDKQCFFYGNTIGKMQQRISENINFQQVLLGIVAALQSLIPGVVIQK